MNRPVSVGLVVLLLAVSGLSIPATAVAAPAGPADADLSPVGTAMQVDDEDENASDFDPQTTTFEITVHENGSITWTFRHERHLAHDEVENFESYAEEFEAGETRLYDRFINQSESLTETGADRTDREMEATNYRPSATVQHRPDPIGVVELSFTWHGFAEVEDDRVVIGDAFEDMYLADYHTLVVQPGDGLVFADADPEGDHNGDSLRDADEMTWQGEEQFDDGYPQVVFTGPDGSVSSSGSGPLSWLSDLPLGPLAALFVLLAFVVGAFAWKRDSSAEDDGAATDRPGTGDGDGSDPPPLADEELLTDEDRVVRLIRENGGRMKQVNIVEETGWSKSKVSMLLSDMEEEGTISKLRVGRENIISLEGFEPEATKSPFEN